MVNKRLVIISYCCIFLFILFCAVGYIIIPTYWNKAFHKSVDLPKTAVMDNAASAMSAIPTNTLFVLVLVVIIIVSLLFIFGSFSMFSAY